MPKKKRLTQKEVKERAAFKKELKDKGVIPPDKTRLNRKKFAKDVLAEYKELMTDFDALLYIHKAIGCMVSENMREITSEEVGVLKLLKLAIESKKFSEALRAEGRSEYTIGEYIDKVVHPILKL